MLYTCSMLFSPLKGGGSKLITAGGWPCGLRGAVTAVLAGGGPVGGTPGGTAARLLARGGRSGAGPNGGATVKKAEGGVGVS